MVFTRELIIEYDGLKVALSKFKSAPKITAENTGEVAYSINGTPIDSGIQYEEHRIWEIEAAMIPRPDRDALEIIAQSQNKKRRLWSPDRNYQVILHDWIAEYQEPIGRTRALARRTDALIQSQVRNSLNSLGAIVGVSYYAQWNVRFLNRIEWEDSRTNSTEFAAKFTLKELDRING